jgi:AcrR family transcriptional regulator
MRPISARDRILEAAYELFSARGVATTGISAIIARAGVARMSLYQNFRSKDDLVIAFLTLHEQRFTHWWQNEIKQRETSPSSCLLAIFDVFDEWFQSPSFQGCSFINILMETYTDGPIRQAAAHHLYNIRYFLQELAEEAKISDPESFARLWHMMMMGAIVSAQNGHLGSARLAKGAGEMLLKNWQGLPAEDLDHR